MTLKMKAALAAVALGGLTAATATAQPPAAPAAPAVPAAPVVQPAPPEPQVIRWPGGYMILNGPEMIMRQEAPGKSTTVISGAGNGVGNKIVVDNGGAGGVTVVRGSKIGIGNKIVVDPDDLLIDLDELLGKPKIAPPAPMAPPKAVPVEPVPADPNAPPAALPAPPPPAAPAAAAPSYKGKASPFWTKKAFSEALDCNVYWCPTTKLWFRYGAEDDTYRPAATQPPAPTDEK